MHNSIKKIPIIINQLNKGESIALVSDAGMPSICDPGENLVREVKLNKLKTICIPIINNKNKQELKVIEKINLLNASDISYIAQYISNIDYKLYFLEYHFFLLGI